MKYNHALFLNPYSTYQSSKRFFIDVFPPTGLEYVATSAKDVVGKLTLLDLRYEKDLSDINKLLDFIAKGIDVICVAIAWDYRFKEVCDLLNQMPNNVPMIVGGYKATEEVEELFKACPKIDIIVRGEGEETIKEVLKGAPLENILGISYRANNGIIHNKNRPLPRVDSIAPPDRSLRRHQYRMALYGINISSVIYDTILSARGCPYDCKFCTFSLNPLGQKRTYSSRSSESVVEEIENITADVILFSDDNFATNVRKAEEICDLIIGRKIKKRFIAQARIEISKYPALLDKMVKAGFKVLLLGIESPHDRILVQLDKGFNSDTIRKSLAILTKYPIYYSGYFIYGNIGETEEEMLYIPKFAKEIGIDSIVFNNLRIDKFSPLREVLKKTPGYHLTDSNKLYSDTYSYAALRKINNRIQTSFYTPLRCLKMAWKFLVVRAFTFREISSALITLPFLLNRIVVRKIQKDRLGGTLNHG